MVLGGANPALATTELIDLSAPTPLWQPGPSMSQARIQLNATILPSGRVLVMGGSRVNDDETTASLNADLFNPATNTFTSAGANTIPRVYHSGSLLLPDATVMLVGGNRARGTYQQGIEIYSPAYLFKADGTGPADRPTIGSVPTAIGYGQAFQIQTLDAASIQSVVLVRPGAQTHAFDMEQRLVRMSFTPGSDQLTVTAPPNGNIAPPGYYMLFVLNAAGVPSHAKFVQLSPSVNQPPTATIVNPAAAVTVNPGQIGGVCRDRQRLRWHHQRLFLDVPHGEPRLEHAGERERDLSRRRGHTPSRSRWLTTTARRASRRRARLRSQISRCLRRRPLERSHREARRATP